MKQSPQSQRLEQLLRSSRIVAGVFLGHDERSLEEIIAADMQELQELGYTPQQLGARMRQLTQQAIAGLGTDIQVDNILRLLGRTDAAHPSEQREVRRFFSGSQQG